MARQPVGHRHQRRFRLAVARRTIERSPATLTEAVTRGWKRHGGHQDEHDRHTDQAVVVVAEDATFAEVIGIGPRHRVLYLPELASSVRLSFWLRAHQRGRVKAPPSRAYPYYEPELVVETPLVSITVE